MNKVYAYILTCLGIIIVLITITFKNNNKIKKIEQERKNKMIEYCNDIYTDLNEEGEFELNLNDIETIYNFDISLFKDKCSLEKTTIKATIKENKLTCEPKLACNKKWHLSHFFYSTVTDLAKFLGLSISQPLSLATL